MAERLGVPRASTDWSATLRELRPDVVGLATPAALRAPVVEAAVALGCHILCEKPLAVDGGEAARLYHRVADASIKHAYAATQVYDPAFRWLASSCATAPSARCARSSGPFAWIPTDRGRGAGVAELATGGGLLNNGLTHLLGILETVVGAPAARAMGEARVVDDRAPVLRMVYGPTGRKAPAPALTPEQATRASGARSTPITPSPRWSASRGAGRRCMPPSRSAGASPSPGRPTACACTATPARSSRMAQRPTSPWLALRARRPVARSSRSHAAATAGQLPAVGDDVQRKWCGLANDFVADIRGGRIAPT